MIDPGRKGPIIIQLLGCVLKSKPHLIVRIYVYFVRSRPATARTNRFNEPSAPRLVPSPGRIRRRETRSTTEVLYFGRPVEKVIPKVVLLIGDDQYPSSFAVSSFPVSKHVIFSVATCSGYPTLIPRLEHYQLEKNRSGVKGR